MSSLVKPFLQLSYAVHNDEDVREMESLCLVASWGWGFRLLSGSAFAGKCRHRYPPGRRERCEVFVQEKNRPGKKDIASGKPSNVKHMYLGSFLKHDVNPKRTPRASGGWVRNLWSEREIVTPFM